MSEPDPSLRTLGPTDAQVNGNWNHLPEQAQGPIQNWLCPFCRKFLGLFAGETVQIRDRQRFQLVASLPVTRQCPRCRKMVSKKAVLSRK